MTGEMAERVNRFEVAFDSATVAVVGRIGTRAELQKAIDCLRVLEQFLPDDTAPDEERA